MTTFDRDTMIRRALTPNAAVTAPENLGDEIYRAIIATPQRRPTFGPVRAGISQAPSPATLVLLIAMLGLFLLGSFIVLSRLAAATVTAVDASRRSGANGGHAWTRAGR